MVLDTQAPALLGVPLAHALDAQVFSGPQAPFVQVYAAGQLRVDGAAVLDRQGVPGLQQHLADQFAGTMAVLWA